MNEMWVYIKAEDDTAPEQPPIWLVGYYTPTGTWRAVEHYHDDFRAREAVHYLNGGR